MISIQDFKLSISLEKFAEEWINNNFDMNIIEPYIA